MEHQYALNEPTLLPRRLDRHALSMFFAAWRLPPVGLWNWERVGYEQRDVCERANNSMSHKQLDILPSMYHFPKREDLDTCSQMEGCIITLQNSVKDV
jgi:hypothetical protein